MSAERRPTITLHSAWGSIAWPFVGAVLLLVGGIVGLAQSGARPLPVVSAGLGVVGLIVMLVATPIATEFSADGVCRRTVLFRRCYRWHDDVALTRGRPGRSLSSRRLTHAGLLLVLRRSRVVLVTQAESRAEFLSLRDLLVDGGVGWVIDEVPMPHDDTAPTWLYRRRRWRPPLSE